MKYQVVLPNVITIGSYDYTIKLNRELLNDHDLLGQIVYRDQIIKIEESSSEQTRHQAFWHEVVHGINDAYSCGLDETTTDRMAHGILQVMKSLDIGLNWSGIETQWPLYGKEVS